MAINALEEANRWAVQNQKPKLQNLWKRLGVDRGLGAFADFTDNAKTEFLWRKYITDETLTRTMFRDLDRIKLTEIIIDKLVKGKKLVS